MYEKVQLSLHSTLPVPVANEKEAEVYRPEVVSVMTLSKQISVPSAMVMLPSLLIVVEFRLPEIVMLTPLPILRVPEFVTAPESMSIAFVSPEPAETTFMV